MNPQQDQSSRSMFVFKKQVELAARKLKISQGEILKKINSLPICPAKTIGEAYNLFNNTEPGSGENVVAVNKIVELFFINLAECKNLDELYSLEIYINLEAIPEVDKNSMIQAYDLRWDEFSLQECEESNNIDEHVNAFRRSRKDSTPSTVAQTNFNKSYSEEIGKFNTSFELRTLADKYEGEIIGEDTRHECRLKYKKLCYLEAENELKDSLSFLQTINIKLKAEQSDDGYLLSNKIQETIYGQLAEVSSEEKSAIDYRLLFSHSSSRSLNKKVLEEWLANTNNIFDLIEINFKSSGVSYLEDLFYDSREKMYLVWSKDLSRFNDTQQTIDYLTDVFNNINKILACNYKFDIFHQNLVMFTKLIKESNIDQIDYFFKNWRNDQTEGWIMGRYLEVSNSPEQLIELLNIYETHSLAADIVSHDDVLRKLDKTCLSILDNTKNNDPDTVEYLIELTDEIEGLSFTEKAYDRFLTMI